MPAKRILAIGLMAIMLSGCGQLVSEKLTVTSSATTPECPISKRLVILPLADYSYVDDVDTALQRNLAIMENLTDKLVSNGYQMPIHEDLLKYLSDQKIIRVKAYGSEGGKTRYLEKELASDWSSAMKDELASLIAEEQDRNTTGSFAGTNSLDNKTLTKIASAFNAGYIMRGRIVKFELEEENTWRPLKRGLLPVIIGGTTRALFGVARSEDYDTLDQMAVGAASGAVIGSNVKSSTASSSTYGMAGAATALLASQSGRANQASVELRLWVQSPVTGDVVWTNRVEVKVKPQTMYADTNPAGLYKIAVERAVAALVDDFVSKTEGVL